MVRDLQQAPESLFWYWINERHHIYLRRQTGEPKPWTSDPILQSYKFTNAFRQLDRGTVWLTDNFLQPHADDDLQLLAFNICWYRMFNWWGTGELLGWQTETWWADQIKTKLHDAALRGQQVFTNAHIVYSPPGRSKIDAITDVCTELFVMRDQFVRLARRHQSLATVFEALTEVYCVGGFMAYEMVSDMRHTRLLSDAKDIMTWANMGPGAKRGLTRLGLPCKNQREGIESMRRLLLDSEYSSHPAKHRKYCDTSRLEAHVPLLEMRDIEHSLCEFDKYCRVKFGEGEPRMRFDGR